MHLSTEKVWNDILAYRRLFKHNKERAKFVLHIYLYLRCMVENNETSKKLKTHLLVRSYNVGAYSAVTQRAYASINKQTIPNMYLSTR